MIVVEEQLLEATGYTRAADMEKCLLKQGIKLFYGKDRRIWTTSEILARVAIEGRLDAPTFDI